MLKLKGTMEAHGIEMTNRVYDRHGACPTISTCGGGNTQPKTIKRYGTVDSNGRLGKIGTER